MTDGVYSEVLVKRKMAFWAILSYIGLGLGIFIALLLIITATEMMVGGILFAVVGTVAFIFWRFLKVEYEYIFVTDELQIDKIYSGETRKKGPRIAIQDMESVDLTDKNTVRNAKFGGVNIEDFTSGQKDREVYAVRYTKNGQPFLLLFEPDEKMLRLMEKMSPRKIHIAK